MTAQPATHHPDNFYRAFEDRHRGSRELIKERLRAYLSFIVPLAGLHPGLPALDVGCGRGEWLELLGDHQIPGHGVDTDDGMLAACRERGLRVAHADAIGHLETLGPHSLLAVTGFHVAEHLPFDVLRALIAQARRVLVPGGLLILETPNPENLLVGAANFYLDPTHQRPLPSQLLSFLVEHQGFAPVKVVRLQEEARLAQNGPVSLYDVLANVSPDYAVVARSPLAGQPSDAHEQALDAQLAQAFAQDGGVSLPALARRYDDALRQQADALRQQADAQRQAADAAGHKTEAALAHIERLGSRIDQLNLHAEQLNTHNQQLDAHIGQLGRQALQFRADMERVSSQSQALGAHADQLAAQLGAVHASHSWRLTGPLRWLARRFRGKSG